MSSTTPLNTSSDGDCIGHGTFSDPQKLQQPIYDEDMCIVCHETHIGAKRTCPAPCKYACCKPCFQDLCDRGKTTCDFCRHVFYTPSTTSVGGELLPIEPPEEMLAAGEQWAMEWLVEPETRGLLIFLSMIITVFGFLYYIKTLVEVLVLARVVLPDADTVGVGAARAGAQHA